jgi:hypothetical protein
VRQRNLWRIYVGLQASRSLTCHKTEIAGKAASANANSAEGITKMFEKIAEEGGYFSKQICNVAESELFWKRVLLQTYIFQEENLALGFKAVKEQLALLLVGNTEAHKWFTIANIPGYQSAL